MISFGCGPDAHVGNLGRRHDPPARRVDRQLADRGQAVARRRDVLHTFTSYAFPPW